MSRSGPGSFAGKRLTGFYSMSGRARFCSLGNMPPLKRALAKSYLLISLLPPRNSLEVMGLYRGRSSQLEYNGLDCLCRIGFP